MKKTLVIIPAYNEEKNIEEIIKKCKHYCSNILVVDDGSTDNTAKIVKENKVSLLKNKKNNGKGFSIRRGISFAIKKKFDKIVFIDADGEREPSDILKLLRNLTPEKDFVIGIRNKYRSKQRKLLNKFVVFWLNLATNYNIKDVCSGFFAFKVNSIKELDLISNGFEIETEIILESFKHGLEIVPQKIKSNKFSESKLKKKDYLIINIFFDKWIIKNIFNLKLSKIKKIFLFISSIIGLLIGKSLQKL